MVEKDNNNKIENKEEIPIEVSPDLEQVYMTGAIGGYTPHDFRLVIFSEKAKGSENDPYSIRLIRNVSHEIVMSHSAVQELYAWLGKHVKQYDEELEKMKNQED